ncbi:MAG: hypothetical protein JXB32_07660 [Deltaproteobacteria bacterium]|nr:hypothetical protein [Deltaproteobacteria bacterium]
MRPRWPFPLLLGSLALGCSPRPSVRAPADAARPADVPPPAAAAGDAVAPAAPNAGAPAWPALVEVGVGDDHSCALAADGAVYCWGGSSRGQLGIGGFDPRPTAVRVHGLDDATDLAVGFAHACVVRRTGRVACWGLNHGAALGDGTTTDRTLPVEVLDLEDAVEVAAGLDLSCARRRDGTVACWGRNLARGPLDPGPEHDHLARPVEGLENAVGLAVGSLHACAALRDGRATCWGSNFSFAVGPDDAAWPAGEPFGLPFEGVRQVAAGSRHGCVLRETGEIRCWGGNHGRQLDHPDERATIPALRARTPPDLGPARQVAAGERRTCAVLADGTVSCWGDGRQAPQPVAGLPPASRVALCSTGTDGHACALTTAGEPWCWGRNHQGQLGDGSRTASAAPVRVRPPASTDPVPVTVEEAAEAPFEADELAVGYDQTCARRGGRVWCWGRPPAAMLHPAPPELVHPAPVPGLDDVVQLAAGFGFFCARRENGEVACWGENSSGQLGDGTTVWRPTPVQVTGLDRAESLVADYGRACALRSGGEVWCWGEGTATAAPVEALRSWKGRLRQLALSDGHCCVLLEGGEVRCQGDNSHGQIGNGEGGCRPDPEDIPCGPPGSGYLPRQICAEAPEFVLVRELGPAVELALGSGFSCARHEGGAVSCWGWNHQAQLGRGYGFVEAEGWLPAPVAGLEDAVGLCADAGRACALKSDGTAVCWGQNVFGELGDRTTQNRPSPSLVHDLAEVVELGTGQSHTCARTADRRIRCWGDNNHGQLGDGSLERRPAPVLVRSDS